MQIFFDCLLYFTSFAEVFALFASVLSLAAWLLKALVVWLIAEPETSREGPQFRPANLDYLKRAGQ